MKNYLKTQPVISSVAFCFPPVLFISYNIHAYIDPGTGSLLLQVLIASFVGALFLAKVFWGKIKAFFSNLFSKVGKGNG